jgi:hypothetical protein
MADDEHIALAAELQAISQQIDDWAANKIGLIDWGRNQVSIDRAAAIIPTLITERDAAQAEASAWANKALDMVGGMRTGLISANDALRNAALFVGSLGYEGAAGQLQAAADAAHAAQAPKGGEST